MVYAWLNPLHAVRRFSLSTHNISLNLFVPNGIPFHQFDKFIFVLRVVVWYFDFHSKILIEHSVSKQRIPYMHLTNTFNDELPSYFKTIHFVKCH